MKEALISMGYREVKENVFAKPIAFNIFIFEIVELRWTNWFTGTNEAKLIWDSHIYEKGDNVSDGFLNYLKYCEAYTRLSDRYNNLEFVSLKEKLESIL